jgi:hypothetical protein
VFFSIDRFTANKKINSVGLTSLENEISQIYGQFHSIFYLSVTTHLKFDKFFERGEKEIVKMHKASH